MQRRIILLVSCLVSCLSFTLTGCHREQETLKRTLGFDEFRPEYNRYIQNWIHTQKAALQKEEAHLNELIATAGEEQKVLLEGQLASVRKDSEKMDFRLGLGDYLKIGNPSEVPTDLVWQNGQDQPEIGDPRAIKGGVFRKEMSTFPPTLRPFGDNSNNGFRSDIYDDINLDLVHYHPETMAIIPGIAKEWAMSQDGRTIYFHIDPDARYSNGKKVRALDYLITIYVNVSDNVSNPFYKQAYREDYAQFAAYGDDTLAISLPEAKYYAALFACEELAPSEPDFYSEYGPDYSERYQWRFPPTTGAYDVKPEGIVKGASITQTRVKDWWAKDKKFYRYRFNPDKIVNTVVRDSSKAFELFRAGEIDTFPLTLPQYWYEKSEMPPVYNGYIERVTYYKRFPKVPRGLYLNVRKAPLDNKDVRIGINYAMNWQKVIDVIFRGDFQRLNSFFEGFEGLSDSSITARPYSIMDARNSFAAAGYTQQGSDGILKKPDGTRLEVSLTYPSAPEVDRMMSILREDAKACGLDLKLDGLEATVVYKKEMQKQHQMALGAWNFTPPMPDPYQYLHSSTALDEKGNPKPQTNNVFGWARPDTDRISLNVRTARTLEELRSSVQQIQHIAHDEGFFIPGYTLDYGRIGFWRWIKWPDCENTRFCPPIVSDPRDPYVFWIDEKVQEETQAARRSGKTFPESTRVIDAYRTPSPTTPAQP